MSASPPPISLRETWSCLRADFDRLLPHMGGARGLIGKLSLFATPAAMCLVLHRLAHWLAGRGLRPLAALLAGLNYVVNKVAISPGARIGPGLFIPHPSGIVLHGHAGARLTVYYRAIVCPRAAQVDKFVVKDDAPRLGDDVTLGVWSVVTGPVSLGSGAFVAAYAVVTESAPDRSVLLDRHAIRVERKPAGSLLPASEGDQPTAR